jgi:hypothetical protein
MPMFPAAVHPDCVAMRGGDILAGGPDISVAVPAVITVAPNPVAVLGWGFWAGFDDASGRSDANNHLRACHERCGKDETANGGEYSLLHQSLLLPRGSLVLCSRTQEAAEVLCATFQDLLFVVYANFKKVACSDDKVGGIWRTAKWTR